MESSKNLFENWVKTQNKFLQDWADASQKIQQNFQSQNTSKTNTMYNDWMEKQQSFFQQMMGKQTQQTPQDLFQQFFSAQNDFSKQWMEAMKSMQNTSGMFQNNNYFGNTTQLNQQWDQIFNQWMNNFGGPFGSARNMTGNRTASETFQNILQNTQTYFKMMEIWQPIQEMISKNQHNINSMMGAVNLDGYKDLISKTFTTIHPQQTEAFHKQIHDFATSLFQNLRSMHGHMEGSFDKVSHMIPSLFGKELTASKELSQEVYEKMKKGFAPLFVMLPPSKEKEMFAMVLDVQEDYSHFYTKANEIQSLIFNTSRVSMEEVIKKISEKLAENKEMVVFEDFYNAWVDITEKNMINLYRSDEFSQKQGELLTLSSSIKKNLSLQMETLLQGLPVAPRSEIDEMNELIHELRRKVRNLERDLKEARAQIQSQSADSAVSEQKASAKATSKKTAESTTKTTSVK